MRDVARWIILGALASSCVEQPPQRRGGGGGASVSQAEIEAVRRRVTSTTAPTPQHPLDIRFGNKVRLLGYNISPDTGSVRPGSSITVTWFWQCEATTGEGWRIFTHLNDHQAPRANHDNDGDVRRAYQPERWRQGEYITDAQTFEIPADWDSPVVHIYLGLWNERERANNGRMPVTRGPADSESRARAVTLNTGVAQRMTELDIPRVTAPIVVDGRLDEPAWRTAGSTGPLTNVQSGGPAGPSDAHGGVKLLWDDQNLYVAWEVTDDNLVETGTQRDQHMWENDAVEMLIDPNGDGRDYYELQVSPGGHTFDTQQPQPPSGGNFGNVAWNPEMTVRVVANGTVGTEGDNDTGYTVEMSIPWSQINAGAAHTPPQTGDQWRMNFFLMDKARNGGMRHAGWSAPRGGSFHVPDRFGRVTFRGAPAAPAGAPGAAPGAPPGAAPGAAPTTSPAPAAPGAAAPSGAAAPAAGGAPTAAAPGQRPADPSANGTAPTTERRPALNVPAAVDRVRARLPAGAAAPGTAAP